MNVEGAYRQLWSIRRRMEVDPRFCQAMFERIQNPRTEKQKRRSRWHMLWEVPYTVLAWVLTLVVGLLSTVFGGLLMLVAFVTAMICISGMVIIAVLALGSGGWHSQLWPAFWLTVLYTLLSIGALYLISFVMQALMWLTAGLCGVGSYFLSDH
jgi:hypothetical protein